MMKSSCIEIVGNFIHFNNGILKEYCAYNGVCTQTIYLDISKIYKEWEAVNKIIFKLTNLSKQEKTSGNSKL